MKVKQEKKKVEVKACVGENSDPDKKAIYDIFSSDTDKNENCDSLSGDKLLDDAFKKAFKKTNVGK